MLSVYYLSIKSPAERYSSRGAPVSNENQNYPTILRAILYAARFSEGRPMVKSVSAW